MYGIYILDGCQNIQEIALFDVCSLSSVMHFNFSGKFLMISIVN